MLLMLLLLLLDALFALDDVVMLSFTFLLCDTSSELLLLSARCDRAALSVEDVFFMLFI